jgi:hypothetical protein
VIRIKPTKEPIKARMAVASLKFSVNGLLDSTLANSATIELIMTPKVLAVVDTSVVASPSILRARLYSSIRITKNIE